MLSLWLLGFGSSKRQNFLVVCSSTFITFRSFVHLFFLLLVFKIFPFFVCFDLGASPMGVNGGVGVQTSNLLSDSMLHSAINSQK